MSQPFLQRRPVRWFALPLKILATIVTTYEHGA